MPESSEVVEAAEESVELDVELREVELEESTEVELEEESVSLEATASKW